MKIVVNGIFFFANITLYFVCFFFFLELTAPEKQPRIHHQFKDHSHYVQGVAMDPLGVYIASQSADRSCRIYSKSEGKKSYISHSVLKKLEAVEEEKENQQNAPKMLVSQISNQSQQTTSPQFSTQPLNQPQQTATPQLSIPSQGIAVPSKADDEPTTTTKSNNPNPTKTTFLRSKMFGDEMVNTFFRRLCWTIDGSLLLVPYGKKFEA